MKRATPLKTRLLAKVVIDQITGCWNWTGAKDRDGYGQVRGEPPDFPMLKAHRASYELLIGSIPDGLVLDHTCRNTSCVNPAHLEPVTNAVNMQRAAALVTHCAQGHPFDADNTLLWRGKRLCRACRAIQYSRWASERGGRPRPANDDRRSGAA